MASKSALVRQLFSGWEQKDRMAVQTLLADDFTFTSPNEGDDHIDQAEYWRKCWPGSEAIQSFRILNLAEDEDGVFVRYECELTNGKRFRNTEYIRVDDDKIRAVDVYFGRSIH